MSVLRKVFLPKHSFRVYLILDSREIHGRVDRSYFQKNLESNGISVIRRNLAIGDFLWVAKSDTEEVVLDYVIERKIFDDLIASIKDGRYGNQKHRLESSGIKNKIYILERSHGFNARELSVKDRIVSVISRVQLVQGFFVKQTASIKETLEYLVRLSRRIIEEYEGRDIEALHIPEVPCKDIKSIFNSITGDNLITFSLYQQLNYSANHMSVRELWVRQLSCIRGVSMEKALLISKTYPTMRHLIEAYNECETESQKASLLQNMGGYGAFVIGGSLSKKIYAQFCSESYK